MWHPTPLQRGHCSNCEKPSPRTIATVFSSMMVMVFSRPTLTNPLHTWDCVYSKRHLEVPRLTASVNESSVRSAENALIFWSHLLKITCSSSQETGFHIIIEAVPTAALGQVSRIRRSNFLSHHPDIGMVFRTTVRLWLTLSWVDYTMNMACWRRLHDFLRVTMAFNALICGCLDTFIGQQTLPKTVWSWIRHAHPPNEKFRTSAPFLPLLQ